MNAEPDIDWPRMESDLRATIARYVEEPAEMIDWDRMVEEVRSVVGFWTDEPKVGFEIAFDVQLYGGESRTLVMDARGHHWETRDWRRR